MVIFADGCDQATMAQYANDPMIGGFTTNPSLMKKSGVRNYREFAHTALRIVGDKSISFEVLSDDFSEMEKQAEEITSWGENVWCKIPITNAKGESSIDLINRLSDLNLNITAVMTEDQLESLRSVDRSHHIISVFCGRIADTQVLPPYVRHSNFRAKLLWASARQIFSVTEAELHGYDIITLTPDLIAKLPLRGKNLTEYSLETVKQFHEDGKGIQF